MEKYMPKVKRRAESLAPLWEGLSKVATKKPCTCWMSSAGHWNHADLDSGISADMVIHEHYTLYCPEYCVLFYESYNDTALTEGKSDYSGDERL